LAQNNKSTGGKATKPQRTFDCKVQDCSDDDFAPAFGLKSTVPIGTRRYTRRNLKTGVNKMEIWNRETLFVLFSNLKRKFGPYSEWQWRTYPSADVDRNVEYAQYCAKFAEVVGANSGDAVGFMILKATGVKVSGDTIAGERMRAKCVAAALEADFLKLSDDAMAKPSHQHHGTMRPLLETA
jgi:hypothetical protein